MPLHFLFLAICRMPKCCEQHGDDTPAISREFAQLTFCFNPEYGKFQPSNAKGLHGLAGVAFAGQQAVILLLGHLRSYLCA